MRQTVLILSLSILFFTASVSKAEQHSEEAVSPATKTKTRAVAPPTKAEQEEALILALPAHLQEFVRIYKQERPEMVFDSTLAGVAQSRAVKRMAPRGAERDQEDSKGHAVYLNGLVRASGYPLAANIPDRGNYFESLWGSSTAKGALEGWRKSPGHRAHLWGQNSMTATFTHFGIGFSKGQWVFISAP